MKSIYSFLALALTLSATQAFAADKYCGQVNATDTFKFMLVKTDSPMVFKYYILQDNQNGALVATLKEGDACVVSSVPVDNSSGNPVLTIDSVEQQ